MEPDDFLTLPPELIGAPTRELSARYFHLPAIHLALQTRAGCHPSGINNPADVEPREDIREALRVSLQGVEREMIALQYAISTRPDARSSGVPLGMWAGK